MQFFTTAILLAAAFKLVEAAESCGDRNTEAIWLQKCGTGDSTGWGHAATACSSRYFAQAIIDASQSAFAEQFNLASRNCDTCQHQPHDAGTGIACKSVCDRVDEINLQYQSLADRRFCDYTECIINSPCPNEDVCANVFAICETLGDLSNDPFVRAGAAVAAVCGASDWFGDAQRAIGSFIFTGAAKPFMVGCATAGKGIAGIGVVGSAACTACNRWLVSNNCPAKANCSPFSRKRSILQRQAATSEECGPDESLDISGAATGRNDFCAHLEAQLENVYTLDATVMGDLGIETEEFATSSTCDSLDLINGFAEIQVVVGSLLYKQAAGCDTTTSTTLSMPQPSSMKKRRPNP